MRSAQRTSGKKPTLAGVQKRVTAILTGRHMKGVVRRLGPARDPRIPQAKMALQAEKAWQQLKRTLLGKTILFTDRKQWTDEQIVRGYRKPIPR